MWWVLTDRNQNVIHFIYMFLDLSYWMKILLKRMKETRESYAALILEQRKVTYCFLLLVHCYYFKFFLVFHYSCCVTSVLNIICVIDSMHFTWNKLLFYRIVYSLAQISLNLSVCSSFVHLFLVPHISSHYIFFVLRCLFFVQTKNEANSRNKKIFKIFQYSTKVWLYTRIWVTLIMSLELLQKPNTQSNLC